MANTKRIDSAKLVTRAAAAVIGCLLIAFFVVTVNNMVLISNQVEDIKNGPFKVSMNAGRIETNLARLDTVINQLVSSHGSLSNTQDVVEICQEVDETISSLLAGIDKSTISNPESIHLLNVDYQMLSNRLGYLINMCLNENISGESIANYTSLYVSPLIAQLLANSAAVLDETTAEVNNMYTVVNAASGQTILMSSILMAAVVVMVFVYMVLLRRKDAREQKLREDLELTIEQAKSASNAKSMFLSNMSHDIRTPMNAIVGLTTVANENLDDPVRVKQCLTRITTSSQHLLSLINDALDMNKIESGKATLNEEVFSVQRLMEELTGILQPSAAAKHLNTTTDMKNITYDVLIGDTMRIRQIILNLISNAIKYTNEGDDVQLSITELPQTKPGIVDLQFIVEDSGIGMKREFLEYVFEPFERERNDFTNFTEGTGLGMAITKNLVQLMSGKITVESELGVGTRFTVRIPLKIADSANIKLLTEKQEDEEREEQEGTAVFKDKGKHVHDNAGERIATTATAASSKKKVKVSGRVLLVEDNEINMDIAQELVTSRGAEVECAYDGIEAVSKVADSPEGYYDLIFMDWQMPHMDGIEATRTIIQFCKDRGRTPIPIIAMTANAFVEDREVALEAGMDGFMTKPINVKELEANLLKYLPAATDDESEDADAHI